jgi:hypothetical protein
LRRTDVTPALRRDCGASCSPRASFLIEQSHKQGD